MSKTQSAARIGKWFYTDVATRQGDLLSPLLFVTDVEQVTDQVKESNCRRRLT